MKRKFYKLVQICLIVSLLVISLSSFVGCNNEFARQEYSNNEKIAGNADRSAKIGCIFTELDNKLILKADGFDGRETLWNRTFSEEKEYNLEISLTLTQGKAKIVLVDKSGMVITLIERTAEDTNTANFSDSLTLPKGYNRIKLVGYDCKNLNLSITFEEL